MSDANVGRSKYLYPRTVKGKPYLYFRMADGALVPLPLDKNTKEFERSYDACLKARGGLAAQPVADAKPFADVISPPVMKHVAFIGGTVGKAIETYSY
jgi:hypothetical protein